MQPIERQLPPITEMYTALPTDVLRKISQRYHARSYDEDDLRMLAHIDAEIARRDG